MEHKIGDKLVCIKNLDDFLGKYAFNVGKIYTIDRLVPEICIVDDNGNDEFFNILSHNEFNVKLWFDGLKEHRKKKIDKINKI